MNYSATVAKRLPWLIGFSFFLALFLTVLPMPYWAAWFRPEWTFLVLLYWHYRVPDKVGAFTAFILGLALDGLVGSVLGVHSIALLVALAMLGLCRRALRIHGLLIQMLVIVFIAVSYQCSLLVINALLKQQVPLFWAYWAPAILCGLLWPWLCWLLDSRLYPARFGRR